MDLPEHSGYAEFCEILVAIDDDALLERLDEVSGRNLRIAVLRGADSVIGLSVDHLRRILDAEEPDYFSRRSRGLIKDFRRMARAGRATMRSSEFAAAYGGTRFRAGLPMEIGGRYEQYVEPYQRMQTQMFGRPLAEPRSVDVNGHLRNRTEHAHAYMRRAWTEVERVAAEPTARAIEALLGGAKKVPGAATLKKGL